MSADLSSIVFGKQIEIPKLLGPTEKTLFRGFVDKFVPVEDPRGRKLYVHSVTGYGVWERPETILGLLLANSFIPTGLQIERWVSIPRTPLIIIDCGDGRLLLANKINGRVKLDVDEPLWQLLGDKIEKELKGPHFDQDNAAQYHPTANIIDVLDQCLDEDLEINEDDENAPELTNQCKKAFFDSLRENNVPVLGDYDKIFANLISNSKDIRLRKVSAEFHELLLKEYIDSQRGSMEDQAKSQREVTLSINKNLAESFKRLCDNWQKLYKTNAKFKSNYGLFKEKHKQDKTFKEANKYFDLEKLFKEYMEIAKSGTMPGRLYLNISCGKVKYRSFYRYP